MKKLTALLLALVLVLGMATAAMAADVVEEPQETPANVESEFYLTKTYIGTGPAADEDPNGKPAAYPDEELIFHVECDEDNPDPAKEIDVENYNITTDTDKVGAVKIVIPTYTEVGKYNYTITEEEGSTLGVSYSDTEIGVQVFVYYNNDHELVKKVAFTIQNGDGKQDTIVNTFNVGTLEIHKVIAGNLVTAADADDTFTVRVKLTVPAGKVFSPVLDGFVQSEEDPSVYYADYPIKDGGTVTIYNIPVGMTYEVVETEALEYEASYDGSETGTITVDGANTTITNTKNDEIDTGVSLDSLPYILILAVAAVGLVVFVIKRRASVED